MADAEVDMAEDRATHTWEELRDICRAALDGELDATPAQIAGWIADARAIGEQRAVATAMVPAPVPVVYYVRLGSRVKIGFTTNLAQRLVSLSAEEVLAVEPGDYALERRRHQQFAAWRVTGEWFRDCPEIRARVDTLGGL